MPEKNGIMQYFNDNLPGNFPEVSILFKELANRLNQIAPNCAEKSAGLRKLLESKDCFIRSMKADK